MVTTFEKPADSITENYITQKNNPLRPIYHKILEGERITEAEGLEIYDSNDLLSIGILADTARKLRTPEAERNYVYWVHNFHINPTNICEANCTFCSYKKGPKSPFAYVMDVDAVLEMVHKYPGKDTLSEFHIVSGLYEKQGLEYYTSLFKALSKEFPHVHIKAMTAVEMDYMAKLDGIPVKQVIGELQKAGLKSMPGGGAEVFSERMRAEVCLDKISATEWLQIHGIAHEMGINTNATLLAGIGETPAERIDHMIRLRDQQDRSKEASGGFMTFIPLNCYYEGNKIDPSNALTGIENLKNFAVSRILLDNVPHIKAFWVHIGEKMSQVGLNFGVDDLDGTVVQEQVANNAGTAAGQHLTQAQLLNFIWKAGRTPVERDSIYNIKKIYPRP